MVDTSPLIGYLLILSGIAAAMIGYVLFLNLRDMTSPSKNSAGEPANAGPLAAQEEGPSGSDAAQVLEEPLPEQIEQRTNIDDMSATEEHDDDIESEAGDHGGTMESAKEEATEEPRPEERHGGPVAIFIRELESGKLNIRIDDRTYATPEELKASSDWPHVQRLARELSAWISPARPTSPQGARPQPKRPAPEPPVSKPQSMVEQINRILEGKLHNLPKETRAIRIVEGLDGSVKVYIGVDSYPIDEVPFEEVRILIRESVAEWEASQ
jgi:hypothetical protein